MKALPWQALGRGPEALEALSRMGMDRVPRRSKSYLQQLRLSVYTRQASIAIGLEDYAAGPQPARISA